MIVRFSPKDGLDTADQAWFDSNASSNDDAIREIDSEARRHGLVRVREHYLQTLRTPDGEVVRRGFCFRPPASNDVIERITTRTANEPSTRPSSELVREMRDAE